MFHTKNLVNDIKDVPSAWIFQHFCKLKEKLNGQDVKIKSIFTKERTPSMCIYLDKKTSEYKFKDFSSGKGGPAINIVQEIYSLGYYQALQLIIETYNDYVLHNNGGFDMSDFKEQSKYKVSSYIFRSWTTKDQYFWTQFNIGSKLLEEYNVRPLDSYTMTKDGKELTIIGNYLYGYFTSDGTLYKIYQPKTLDKKFIKVTDHIQGIDKLKGYKYLLITSGLKDIMSTCSLKLHIDLIAPDSENTLIKKSDMEAFTKKYNKILVMFDNDEAGIKAMNKYKEIYPFVEIVYLPMSKDISDSVKDFGPLSVRNRLVPIINTKISQ